jgi:hypothetical protein
MNIFHKVLQDYKELRYVCNLLIIFRYFVGMLVSFLFLILILTFAFEFKEGGFVSFLQV